MSNLAETILRDVPRYDAYDVMMTLDGHPLPGGRAFGKWVRYSEVLAALTAAMDPALSERAGEVLSRLRKADEYEPLGHDGWEAADLITALLAQIAALRAERDAARKWAAEQHACADRYAARAEAAEAKVETLRGALQIARVHVANNAEGWSVSRGAARDDLTIVDAALTTEADNG